MLGIAGYEDGTVPVPFSRVSPSLADRAADSWSVLNVGQAPKQRITGVCYGKSISLLWSQSHFHDSVFSLSKVGVVQGTHQMSGVSGKTVAGSEIPPLFC